VRLLTLNISGPSVERADRLHAFLDDVDADVLVLTETRSNAGTQRLLDSFRRPGFAVVSPALASPGERGVAIVQRIPKGVDGANVTAELGHRLLVTRVELPQPVTLVGAYVPSRDTSAVKITRKRLFLEQLSEVLRSIAPREDVILMGDFNVIGRGHHPRYPTFRSWEYDVLDDFVSCDLVDAFAELHPGQQVHSWVGRTGSGYRYDYAFISQGLLPRLLNCEYLQTSREQRLTDHAAVLLTLAADVPRNTVTRSVRVGSERLAHV
jgi:exodeoxyribonuclease-3